MTSAWHIEVSHSTKWSRNMALFSLLHLYVLFLNKLQSFPVAFCFTFFFLAMLFIRDNQIGTF